MNNKIIGVLNLLVAITQLTLSISQGVFVIPRMMDLYKQLNTPGPNLFSTYSLLTLIFVLGISNLFCFYVHFFGSSPMRKQLYTPSIILIVASVLLTGLTIGISVMSVVNPMYRLIESF